MSEFIGGVANYLVTCLVALAVWFFKQLQTKQTKEESKAIEKRLQSEIDDLKACVNKQQEFIFSNVATKKDLEELKIYFKDYLEMIKKEFYGKCRK